MKSPRSPIQVLIESNIPGTVIWNHPALHMNHYSASKLLCLYELYRLIQPVHGCIMEFGVLWGGNLVWFYNLKTLLDPFIGRRIIGFDTFAGFPSVHPFDGNHGVGEQNTIPDYEKHLEEILLAHESNIYHGGSKQHDLIKGDVCVTVPQYLAENPQTIIALAYFDLDLYEPTKAVLQAIQPHLTKGSVLAFDELNYPDWPGETIAVREVLGLDRYAIKRAPCSTTVSYCVVE